jgi:acetyl esterase/lipase
VTHHLPPAHPAHRRGLIALSGLIALALCSTAVAAQTAQSSGIVPDVEYCTGNGRALLMDVLIPKHRIRTPTPAVLWIHGGGWERGDKNSHAGAQVFADAGFVAATLTYRLSGEAAFPAAIEDCKCAIRFLRANARRFGVDPHRLGVAGSSAGGHLALLIATADQSAGLEGDGGWPNVSSRVQAAASYYGVSDFSDMPSRFPADTAQVIVKFLGGTLEDKPDPYRRASPIAYISKHSPPMLLVHGEQDEVVPIDQSLRMADAYRRAGQPVEFVAMQNTGHDFAAVPGAAVTPSVDAIHARTVEFFERYLLSRPTAAANR